MTEAIRIAVLNFVHDGSPARGEALLAWEPRSYMGGFVKVARVHFRRGFDDSGFAKTILLTEPEQPFLGTVRLEACPTGTSTSPSSIRTATFPSSKGANHADRRRADSSMECGQPHQPV